MCRAFVGWPHPVPGKPCSVILNIVFPSFNLDGMQSNVNCSLHYFKGDEAVIISDKIHNIVASVAIFMEIFSEHISLFSKVVAFRSQINDPSPYIADD